MRKDIPTMAQTRAETIVLDEWVETMWVGPSIAHYKMLGYKYTGLRTKFMCRVCHLTPGSQVKVRVQCPICKKRRSVSYQSVVKYGHTLCLGCSAIKDLSGYKFGRLTALRIGERRKKDRQVFWQCACDCGSLRLVLAGSLLRGSTVSCGCYALDERKSRIGSLNSNWDPDRTDEERVMQRKYPEYKKWIKSVLSRDRYVCQICGSVENVEAHHMYSYAYYPQYRLSTKHGITMCHYCHTGFHAWNGGFDKNCIPSDIDRWLYETDASVQK
jgi:hypothetical protein